MTDATIPRFTVPRAGAVDARCGDELLAIRRDTTKRWFIVRHSGNEQVGGRFATLQAAKEYAHDWLAEYA